MIVELEVAAREYGIKFKGVWGFSKPYFEVWYRAIFQDIPWEQKVKRRYTAFHIGQSADRNWEKRRLEAVAMTSTLVKVVEKDPRELYDKFRDYLKTTTCKLQLPPYESVEQDSTLSDRVRLLLKRTRHPPETPEVIPAKRRSTSTTNKAPVKVSPKIPVEIHEDSEEELDEEEEEEIEEVQNWRFMDTDTKVWNNSMTRLLTEEELLWGVDVVADCQREESLRSIARYYGPVGF